MSRFNQCTPETTIQRAAELLKNSDCASLLVVDATGTAIGTVTEHDLICAFGDGQSPRLSVERIMDRNIVTVPTDYRLNDIMGKGGFRDLQRLVIVNERKEPVGVFSPQDFFILLAGELGTLAHAAHAGAGEVVLDDMAA